MPTQNTKDDEFVELKPFLSWAGSKRKLIRFLKPFIPFTWNKYYEPFLGGGSMFLHLMPQNAEVSDASPSLIATYRGVRDDAAKVIKALKPLKPNKTTFNQMKRLAPEANFEKAAQFIFLNKSCWNGLYRVNSQGIFNVPFGQPRSDFVVDNANLLKCAKLLRRRNVSVKCQDFEAILDRVVEHDFVFLDPPYVTSHNMNGFVDWNEKLFSWSDQVRLAGVAKKLVSKGANVLITNAHHPDVLELYADFYSTTFARMSTLAGDKSRRTQTSEAIFCGGPAYSALKYSAVDSGAKCHGSKASKRRIARPNQAHAQPR
ncbi:MAG: Dam family site-specific DNA-(adenine-N6)-methyltransferase [Rhodospirillaceae bacterium]|nr:Dam family site-specific DNA-(adenine-N6)-methyltransferase [Rhodospirillaceae bacterium]